MMNTRTKSWYVGVMNTINLVKNQTLKIKTVFLISTHLRNLQSIHLHFYRSQSIVNTQSMSQEAENCLELATTEMAINDSLQKTEITEFTEFSIRDSNGRQLDPISAVCSRYGTLYMLSSDSRRHLVLCDEGINGGHPVFLDIGDEYPVSLFGGCYHSAAISNKGEVIFINRYAVKNSPESKLEPVCLPDGEKAVSVACCQNSVVALCSNGRVFLSDVQSGSNVLNFSTVSELSNQEIVCVSGTSEHFLAVSREGRVFGHGSNSDGRFGLGQERSNISSFTEISSLNGNKIRAAYAGGRYSLFETHEGKILACGYNRFGRLFLSNDTNENVYSPTETTITDPATFCIAGNGLSAVFIGGEPPPNTPNRLIQKFE